MSDADRGALARIAEALERVSPPPQMSPDLAVAEAFVWATGPDRLEPVARVARVPIGLLVGIDRSRDTLMANTRQFARGFPANNVLLWGARGMGKSSLVKAAHAEAAAEAPGRLKLIELHREDLPSIGRLLALLRGSECRFLLFCDDLSFDKDDSHYKSLKAVLDGGIEGRPENVVLYATSNRRHLMPRDMIENERQTGVNPSEAVEEKVSLSRPFRAVARIPRLQSGRFPRNDPRLLRCLRDRDRRRRAAGRGDRMVADPRRAVGPGGLAVCHRPRRKAGRSTGVKAAHDPARRRASRRSGFRTPDWPPTGGSFRDLGVVCREAQAVSGERHHEAPQAVRLLPYKDLAPCSATLS